MKYLLFFLALLIIPTIMANSVNIILNDGRTMNLNCNSSSNPFVCYNPSITYTEQTVYSQITCGSTEIFCNNFLNNRCSIDTKGILCCDSRIGTNEQCNEPISDNSNLIIGGIIIIIVGGLFYIYKKYN
jgi:hypothetical protein